MRVRVGSGHVWVVDGCSVSYPKNAWRIDSLTCNGHDVRCLCCDKVVVSGLMASK